MAPRVLCAIVRLPRSVPLTEVVYNGTAEAAPYLRVTAEAVPYVRGGLRAAPDEYTCARHKKTEM